jgi:2-oxoglutarate ferredoxin oxidoreductase subunit alpha
MMEKVELFDPIQRRTDEEVALQCPWATTGRKRGTQKRVITSLRLVASVQEEFNIKLQNKYKEIEEIEVRCEMLQCDDAQYVIVAYGSSARTSMKAVEIARKNGMKVGLLRPQTLWPFPSKQIETLINNGAKGFLSVEMSAGQMVEDVKLAANGKAKVEHYGRMGGVIASPQDIYEALKKFAK